MRLGPRRQLGGAGNGLRPGPELSGDVASLARRPSAPPAPVLQRCGGLAARRGRPAAQRRALPRAAPAGRGAGRAVARPAARPAPHPPGRRPRATHPGGGRRARHAGRAERSFRQHLPGRVRPRPQPRHVGAARAQGRCASGAPRRTRRHLERGRQRARRLDHLRLRGRTRARPAPQAQRAARHPGAALVAQTAQHARRAGASCRARPLRGGGRGPGGRVGGVQPGPAWLAGDGAGPGR